MNISYKKLGSAGGTKIKIKLVVALRDEKKTHLKLLRNLNRITYPVFKMTEKSTRHQIYYKSEPFRPSRTEITSPN